MQVELKGLVKDMKVHILPFHFLFGPCVQVLEKWIANMGAKVTASISDATIQIVLRLDDHHKRRLDIPTIFVATEQASSDFYSIQGVLKQYSSAAYVWCMDEPDKTLFQSKYQIDESKLCYAPLMMGTHWTFQKVFCQDETKRIQVLHFGAEHQRRNKVIDEVKNTLGADAVVNKSASFGDELETLLRQAQVVLVINYYSEPLTYPLHRIACVLRFPHLQVVIEQCENTPVNSMLLQPFAHRLHFVSYNDLAPTAIKLASAPPEEDARVLPSAWESWLEWDGTPKKIINA
jgi:hypothetical protein